MVQGVELAAAAFTVAIIFLIGGGLFLTKLSGRQFTLKHMTKKTFKTFFGFAIDPRAFVVFILVAFGLVLLFSSPIYYTYEQTTGYEYNLAVLKGRVISQPLAKSLPPYISDSYVVKEVGLTAEPIKTSITVLFFRFDLVAIGLVLIISGAILTAYFLAKSANPSESEAQLIAKRWSETLGIPEQQLVKYYTTGKWE